MNPVQRIDEAIDRRVPELDPDDRVGRLIWVLGTACELALIGGLAARALRRRTWRSVTGALAPVVAERAWVGGIGALAERDRPGREGTRPIEIDPDSSSFPSGHASNSFMSAALLADHWPTGTPYLLAALSTASRVALRVHHVTDVIPSAVAGYALGASMRRIVEE